MKKHILTALICSFAAFEAKADIVYPFAEVCNPEITQYCTDIDHDLGECLINHREFLSTNCVDAIEVFGGDGWGWGPEERKAWRAGHHEMFTRYHDVFAGPNPSQRFDRGIRAGGRFRR